MEQTFRLAFVAVMAAAALPSPSFAWGEFGHSAVAEIAQRRLDPAAASAVAALLMGGSLASVSSWADDWRPDHRETSNWHFVDMPVADSTYDPKTECAPNSQKGDCIVAELDRLRSDLRCAPTVAERVTALRFAVHFVGDLTQPWHTIAEQTGGNGIQVTITAPGVRNASPAATNIHAAWDAGLLERSAWDWGAVVDRIEDGWLKSAAAGAPDVAVGTPAEWALDTHRLAQKVYKMTPTNGDLDQAYLDPAIKIIDQQLGLGGLRLARFLNEAYGSSDCPVP